MEKKYIVRLSEAERVICLEVIRNLKTTDYRIGIGDLSDILAFYWNAGYSRR